MKHKTIKKRQISRDCWDLEYTFFKWLEERLPVYLKEGGAFVDLEYHKFEFRGKEYTQKELIERMIHLLSIKKFLKLSIIFFIRLICNKVYDILSSTPFVNNYMNNFIHIFVIYLLKYTKNHNFIIQRVRYYSSTTPFFISPFKDSIFKHFTNRLHYQIEFDIVENIS